MSLEVKQYGNDWLLCIKDEVWKIPEKDFKKIFDTVVSMKSKYRPRIGGKT